MFVPHLITEHVLIYLDTFKFKTYLYLVISLRKFPMPPMMTMLMLTTTRTICFATVLQISFFVWNILEFFVFDSFLT